MLPITAVVYAMWVRLRSFRLRRVPLPPLTFLRFGPPLQLRKGRSNYFIVCKVTYELQYCNGTVTGSSF